jgi:CHAT domain-containing protein
MIQSEATGENRRMPKWVWVAWICLLILALSEDARAMAQQKSKAQARPIKAFAPTKMQACAVCTAPSPFPSLYAGALDLRDVSAAQGQNQETDTRKLPATDTQLIQDMNMLRKQLNDVYILKHSEEIKAIGERNYKRIDELTKREEALNAEYKKANSRLIELKKPYMDLFGITQEDIRFIQNNLDDDTMVVSYAVQPDHVQAWIITHGNMTPFPLKVKEQELITAIKSFRLMPNPKQTPVELLKQLYGWLITPIEKYLTTPVIGIVPDGPLHYLSFAALTKDGQKYFGDDHSLFYLPGPRWFLKVINKRKSSGKTALVMAQSSPPYAPTLGMADDEAREVARLYKILPVIGRAATESRFRSRAGRYGIVHVAGHAKYEQGNPLATCLLLTANQDGSGSSDVDGILNIDEIANMRLENTELVVLSACETNPGGRSLRDGIDTLSEAFITAHVPSIIASRWDVDDKETKFLMTSFHRYYLRGNTKAEALKKAQALTRGKYPLSFVWAAFVLTGDPGSVKPTRLRLRR